MWTVKHSGTFLANSIDCFICLFICSPYHLLRNVSCNLLLFHLLIFSFVSYFSFTFSFDNNPNPIPGWIIICLGLFCVVIFVLVDLYFVEFFTVCRPYIEFCFSL